MRRFFAISFLFLITASLGAWAQGGDPEVSGGTQLPPETPELPQSTAQPMSPKQTEPDPDEYIPDAIAPALDYAGFQKRLVYPALARVNGIEGKVVLRVLVDTNGKPTKCRIDYSDSPILADAAIDAIMATPFIPGSQAGKPVRLWVSVPVSFQLTDPPEE